MMEREFASILARYGQDVRVYTPKTPEGVALRAFFQPLRDRGTVQTVPSLLGQVKQDRFLYLGPAGTALEEDSRVKVDGEVYRVNNAQPIYVGGKLSHWWAVLTHRAQEVAG